MIKTFKDKESEKIWNEEFSKKLPVEIQIIASKKLEMLDASKSLRDLTSPPGNRLEALDGNRKGQYSIRINQKYRICFKFINGDCYEVEIVDYH